MRVSRKDFRAPAKLVVASSMQGKTFEDASLNCIDCNNILDEYSLCPVHNQQLNSFEDPLNEVEELSYVEIFHELQIHGVFLQLRFSGTQDPNQDWALGFHEWSETSIIAFIKSDMQEPMFFWRHLRIQTLSSGIF